MNSTTPHTTQSIDIIFDSKIEQLINEFPGLEVIPFLEKLNKKVLFNTGHYSYTCNACGGTWFFQSKAEKKIFTRFHQLVGCSKDYSTDKNIFFAKRSDDLLPGVTQELLQKKLDVIYANPT